jgi:hypothetical protein
MFHDGNRLKSCHGLVGLSWLQYLRKSMSQKDRIEGENFEASESYYKQVNRVKAYEIFSISERILARNSVPFILNLKLSS